MRRSITYPFWTLGLFLFCWINLPKKISDPLRSLAAAPFISPRIEESDDESNRLRQENQRLRDQLEKMGEWMVFYDQRVQEESERLKQAALAPFSEKRRAHWEELLFSHLFSLPAQVTYRDPSSWSSSLWVNAGEASNRSVGKKVVCKNSPVLSEGALVGVIEYVGEKHSRIRLLTDGGLSPAVRVNRGGGQNRDLARKVEALWKILGKRDDLFSSPLEKKGLEDQLFRLIERSGKTGWEDGYLAKGEIHGSSAPFWRSRSPTLKGVGFNFDYPDDEGEHKDKAGKPIPLLKEGDFLVTSGLDGVFPFGLPVGIVSKVFPLKRGSHSYDINVRPSAGNLNELKIVSILPPIGD